MQQVLLDLPPFFGPSGVRICTSTRPLEVRVRTASSYMVACAQTVVSEKICASSKSPIPIPNNVPDFHSPLDCQTPKSPKRARDLESPHVVLAAHHADCLGCVQQGKPQGAMRTKGPNLCVAPHKLLSPPSGCQPVAPSLFSSSSDERAITFRLLSRYQYEVPISIPTTCTYDKQSRQTRPTAAVHRVSGLAFPICCVA